MMGWMRNLLADTWTFADNLCFGREHHDQKNASEGN